MLPSASRKAASLRVSDAHQQDLEAGRLWSDAVAASGVAGERGFVTFGAFAHLMMSWEPARLAFAALYVPPSVAD